MQHCLKELRLTAKSIASSWMMTNKWPGLKCTNVVLVIPVPKWLFILTKSRAPVLLKMVNWYKHLTIFSFSDVFEKRKKVSWVVNERWWSWKDFSRRNCIVLAKQKSTSSDSVQGEILIAYLQNPNILTRFLFVLLLVKEKIKFKRQKLLFLMEISK